MKTDLPAGNQKICDILDAFCRGYAYDEGDGNVGKYNARIPGGASHVMVSNSHKFKIQSSKFKATLGFCALSRISRDGFPGPKGAKAGRPLKRPAQRPLRAFAPLSRLARVMRLAIDQPSSTRWRKARP